MANGDEVYVRAKERPRWTGDEQPTQYNVVPEGESADMDVQAGFAEPRGMTQGQFEGRQNLRNAGVEGATAKVAGEGTFTNEDLAKIAPVRPPGQRPPDSVLKQGQAIDAPPANTVVSPEMQEVYKNRAAHKQYLEKQFNIAGLNPDAARKQVETQRQAWWQQRYGKNVNKQVYDEGMKDIKTAGDNAYKDVATRRQEAIKQVGEGLKIFDDQFKKVQAAESRFGVYETMGPGLKKQMDSLAKEVYEGRTSPEKAETAAKTMGANLDMALHAAYDNMKDDKGNPVGAKWDAVKLQAAANLYQNVNYQKMFRQIKSAFKALDEYDRLAQVNAQESATPVNSLTGAIGKAWGGEGGAKRALQELGNLGVSDEFNRIMGSTGGAVEYFKGIQEALNKNYPVKMTQDLVKEAKYYIGTRMHEYAQGTRFEEETRPLLEKIVQERPYQVNRIKGYLKDTVGIYTDKQIYDALIEAKWTPTQIKDAVREYYAGK